MELTAGELTRAAGLRSKPRTIEEAKELLCVVRVLIRNSGQLSEDGRGRFRYSMAIERRILRNVAEVLECNGHKKAADSIGYFGWPEAGDFVFVSTSAVTAWLFKFFGEFTEEEENGLVERLLIELDSDESNEIPVSFRMPEEYSDPGQGMAQVVAPFPSRESRWHQYRDKNGIFCVIDGSNTFWEPDDD